LQIGGDMEKEKPEKLKFAFYWAASCGGCEIAVLDMNEKILDIVATSLLRQTLSFGR